MYRNRKNLTLLTSIWVLSLEPICSVDVHLCDQLWIPTTPRPAGVGRLIWCQLPEHHTTFINTLRIYTAKTKDYCKIHISDVLLAGCRYIREDTQQEVSLQAGVKGRGNDDVAALLQVLAQKHAAGVNVDGAAHCFLDGVHAVRPVELHLSEQNNQLISYLINEIQY